MASLDLSQPLIELALGVKRSGRQADRSLPSTAEIKNA
jgi:hypothetical protein